MVHESRYVSTSKAARILGVSATLVKTLVDQRKLQGWKTQGGHRRISLESIEAYLSGFQSSARTRPSRAVSPGEPLTPQPSARSQALPELQMPRVEKVLHEAVSLATPQITVAVENPQLLSSIRARFDRVVDAVGMNLPRLVDSPLQALREIAPDRPNVLVLQMNASQAHQENTLAVLNTIAPEGPPISVLVVTPYAQIKLPTPISKRCCLHVFSGPVSLDWSRGCMAGMLTLLTSLQWIRPEATCEDHHPSTPALYAAVA